MSMNPWKPDADPYQARRIGKTLEELSELSAVLARISIQGIDAIDPASGKTNRQRLIEEHADVIAQLQCNLFAFDLPFDEIKSRSCKKQQQMAEWEAHFKVNQ
jgi:hypothetical protein